jgi:mono/diheme cytochrome c family protein
LFGLDGTLSPVQPGAPVSRIATAPPANSAASVAAAVPRLADANLVDGKRLFEQACVFCHGTDGKGDHGGASLVAVTDLAAAMRTVTAGRNTMPPFGTTFTPQQIRDVSAYIVETFKARDAR